MFNKDKILNFEKRKEIYNLILKNPGLHLRELERKLDFSFGTLRYHLDYMAKKGLLMTKHDKGFLRYYVSNYVGNGDKDLLCAFRQPVLRKILIILLLCSDKRVFFKEDFRDLPYLRNWYNPDKSVILKHRTTLEFHLNKLVKLDILQIVKVKRKTGYSFEKEEEIFEFLIRYSNALPYKDINELLYWANRLVIPNLTEPVLHSFFEVFPHPYHV